MQTLRQGCVIPCMPLALTEYLKLDVRHQRALLRYYMDAGVGGIAVGAQTTQFAIRDPEIRVFEPVLKLASDTVDSYGDSVGRHLLKVVGVCGDTAQAVSEAQRAVDLGYHAGLVNMETFSGRSVEDQLAHCRAVAEHIPLFGFSTPTPIGGERLPYEFWREFCEIYNVVAVRVAPFDRYQTLDVVRAVAECGRQDITLYTGNEDHILLDLLNEFEVHTANGPRKLRIRGGLLRHWAVWTRCAVQLLREAHELVDSGAPMDQGILTRAANITDMNGAIRDVANNGRGGIAGVHYVLSQQGLFRGTWCLDPAETLSPGQEKEIQRVCAAYPQLTDDDFVRNHLREWLAD